MPKLLILSIITLLNMALTILRGVKNTLVVADSGGAAWLIPYYDLLGALPSAFVLSWSLARLLRRVEIKQLFHWIVVGFFLFFTVYGLWLYPAWRSATVLYPHNWLLHLPTLLFFSAAELWKIALLSILLWGYLNRNIPMERAKALYGPMMLGTSLGAILAHPLVQWIGTPELINWLSIDSWHASLMTQLCLVGVIGLLTMLLFQKLTRILTEEMPSSSSTQALSLVESLQTSLHSSHLRNLGLIVVSDYIVYSILEVIFLDRVKEYYPDPSAYYHVMTQLAQCGGILTALTALYFSPRLLSSFSWQTVALITPLLILPLTTLFFCSMTAENLGILSHASSAGWILWGGYLFYCMGRATKYALLDATKELAFIPLSPREQLQGKLVIESIANRGGRALAALLNITLFGITGGIASSSPIALSAALLGNGIWIAATLQVGRKMEQHGLLSQNS